ncbi:hypothetical protein SAMN05216371_7646 [Streptomyces sp. TLI_053]|uniref:hypothetical protein n=1 Tax=Streptomyces sp. TLI_053 TaxID=1855352 RepID=UPI00087C94D2|nr:hypothetical protein [Streptomyces sp. TLI_053]SDT82839.1 hypothetical protein SAMN05216371_7646 [Streptomyces sp. TLI_053]
MEHNEPPADVGAGAADASAYDICDHCGLAVIAEDLLGAIVPDSSAVHVSDPELDGRRVVTACSAGHLAALVEVYRSRPFVPEEQYAAKVCRTLADYDEPVPLGVVAALSGLSEDQAQQGVDWHNARAQEWRARYGDLDGVGDELDGPADPGAP